MFDLPFVTLPPFFYFIFRFFFLFVHFLPYFRSLRCSVFLCMSSFFFVLISISYLPYLSESKFVHSFVDSKAKRFYKRIVVCRISDPYMVSKHYDMILI